MTPEEQEARSRQLSNDAMRLIRLRTGRWACFNVAGELCGIGPSANAAVAMWKPCACRHTSDFAISAAEVRRQMPIYLEDLEELGLL